MMDIKSAYNFAPINEKVFLPHWGPYISHDIPFADGRSGEIHIQLESETPIYVRNGVIPTGEEEEHKDIEFSKDQEEFFIPGSSIKGMLRAYMEIFTLGRLSQVNDKKYSYREISTSHEYHTNFLKQHEHTRIGWFIKKDGGYYIQDAGIVDDQKVKYNKINIGGVSFSKFINDRIRSCFDFYQEVGKSGYPFKNIQDATHPLRKGNFCYVFTGQITQDNFKKAKKHHYLARIYDESRAAVWVPDRVLEPFLLSMYDTDKKQINKEWAKWKQYLKQGHAVPVFYHTDGDSDAIAHFGIVRTYRLPYKNKMDDFIYSYQSGKGRPDARPDMAASIFGFALPNEEDALKGRVHISHAVASKAKVCDKMANKVLLGPRPTFINYYIQQQFEANEQPVQGYIKQPVKSWNTGSVVSGRKIYPQHAVDQTDTLGNLEELKKSDKQENKKINKNIAVSFKPLEAGAKFHTCIRFHNLLPAELGALISALTFHHHQECRHSIGGAKPLGFGRVKIAIDESKSFANSVIGEGQDIQFLDKALQRDLLVAMQAEIANQLGLSTWASDAGILELLNMSTPKILKSHVKLKYPTLKEFQKKIKSIKTTGSKKNKSRGLPPYSKLIEDPVREFEYPIGNEKYSSPATVCSLIRARINQHLATIRTLKKKLEINKNAEKNAQQDTADRRLAAKLAAEAQQKKETIEQKRRIALSSIPQAVQQAKKFKSLENAVALWLRPLEGLQVPDPLLDDFELLLLALWDDNKTDRNKIGDWQKKASRMIPKWLGAERGQEFIARHQI